MFKHVTMKNNKKKFSLISIAAVSLALTPSANATIVEFQTSQGDFQVNLFDQTTPHTVNNFLNYVNDGYYTNTIVHRVIIDFIVQAGGYQYDGFWPLTRLTPNEAVINEPFYSNVAGTIAMAKISNDPHSATDQWFFNLADNSENLDLQNSGFTVFGQVIDGGMEVINKISALTLCSSSSTSSIPMVMSEDQVCSDMTFASDENFVIINSITIVDSSAATAIDLNPQLTIYPDSDGDGVKDIYDAFPLDPLESIDTDLDGIGNNADDDDDGDGIKDIDDAYPLEPAAKESGGSSSWLALAVLSLLTLRKRLYLFR